MVVVAIIFSILLLLALLRVGVIIVYNTDGVSLWLKIGFLKIAVDTKGKSKKRKNKDTLSNLKPGSLREFKEILKIIKNTLGRLRRKLLIKRLILHITFAGDDPSKVALQYGSANAIFGAILPVLKRNFRIKRYNLDTSARFEPGEPEIYAKLIISIAVWEAIYTASAILPLFNTLPAAAGTDNNDRKRAEKDGKRTDKQPA